MDVLLVGADYGRERVDGAVVRWWSVGGGGGGAVGGLGGIQWCAVMIMSAFEHCSEVESS